uniref:Uncharacterized protein n=1 Tax=Parascaris univalens TaxID=6257 RepID=A0A915A2X9_PARUN
MSSTRTSEIGSHMSSSVVSPVSATASVHTQNDVTKSISHEMASGGEKQHSDGYWVDFVIVAASKKRGHRQLQVEADCPKFEPDNVRINKKNVHCLKEDDL